MSKNTTKRTTRKAKSDALASQAIEASTRAVFDFLHDERLLEPQKNDIQNTALEILENAGALYTWEVFRVAWPLALATIEETGDDYARSLPARLVAARADLTDASPEKGRQYTPILMEAITREDYAVDLAKEIITFSGATDSLIELVAGIAGIESALTRQEIAAHVIRAAYSMTDDCSVAVAHHVAQIYERGKGGQR